MKKKFMNGVGKSNFFKVLRIMRLSAFFLVVFALQTWASSSYSQQTRVTFNLKNVKVLEVLNEIEKSTNYYFLFNKDLVDIDRLVSVSADKKEVDKVLTDLFTGTNVRYVMSDRQIVLTTDQNRMLQNQQVRSVSGKVTDSSGSSLPGVTVVVEGTTQGTITDASGNYSIDKVPVNAKLIFSFVGMKTQEIIVLGKTTINVILVEESIGLDELVVVGYGTQKKVNLTGAVSQVSSEKLENRSITSSAQGLQGLIPNLNITFESGEPGNTGTKFNIRGGTSINGGEPLILVDGVEQDLELINPNDIESVSVLKDAASSAIYGARAAFGVILVTTKQAKRDMPTRITYSGQFSLNTATRMPKLIDNSYDYALAVNQSMSNFDGSEAFTSEQVEKIKAYYENPENNPEWEEIDNTFYFYGYSDWKKELIKDFAPTQKHDIKVTGGGKKSSYYVSLGYLKQEGIYKKGTDVFERYNTRINVNNEVNEWMDLNFRVAYNNKKTDKPHVYRADENYVNTIVFSRPTNPKEYLGDREEFYGMPFFNPSTYQEKAGRDTYISHDLWLTTEAVFKVADKFKIKTDFSYQNYSINEQENSTKIEFITPEFIKDYSETGNDYVWLSNFRRNHYAFNIYGQYENRFGEDHYVNGTVGYNQEWRHEQTFTAQRKNLITADLPAINLGIGDQTVDGSEGEYAIRGVFYRLNYIYKDKYLVEFNGRYDGTSRFKKESRFGFFPSISGAWRISEEKFFNSAFPSVDNLKLRVSYGELGNQHTSSYYEYIAEMASGQTTNYLFNDEPALYIKPPKLIPTSLTWETITTVDYGIDLNLFRNKLELIFDKYTRITSDMLMQKSYPELLGTNAPYENAAELKTRGWEIAIHWKDKIGKDFTYGVELSLSDNETEITKYENPSGSLDDWYVGSKFGEIWGYETEGIFQNESDITSHADQSSIAINLKPGDIMYKDLPTVDTNGDGIADAGDGIINRGSYTLGDKGDLKIIGNSTPRYIFGINLNTSYKMFFANIFLQGVGKREFWPSDGLFWPFYSQWYQIQTHFITDSWNEDNRDAYFGRLLARDARNRQVQSRYIQDASYIRLKNITLGYNLPKIFTQKIGVESGKIYVSGQNLWVHSNVGKPYDPEGITTGRGLLYPFQKTYSLGLNITF